MILWPDRIVRGLRQWLLFQLRLVRRPGYRRMLKIYGWLLFVSGALLMILLVLMRRYEPMSLGAMIELAVAVLLIVGGIVLYRRRGRPTRSMAARRRCCCWSSA